MAAILCLITLGTLSSAIGRAAPLLPYGIQYTVSLDPQKGGAEVELRVTQRQALLREIDMRIGEIDPDSLEADGNLNVSDERVRWSPPPDGGALRWFVPIDNRRSTGGKDAHIESDWALFRAEDVVPRVRSRSRRGAASITTLRFELPDEWSVITEYRERAGRFAIDNPSRRFDQPTGWILAGQVGTRNETIAGSRVVVAGPLGAGVRRMDVLALLQWTLPELAKIVPEPPPRITVVRAGAPMWRGGLSAPASLYLHADRPLISENGTSTLLHEVMHVALDLRADDDSDWIIEGLAEYYSLELLRRSGTITSRRYEKALAELSEWGKTANGLCGAASTGPTTAKAVGVFVALNRDLRRNSAANLDTLVRRMVTERKEVSLASMQALATEIAGHPVAALSNSSLDGCET